MSRLCRVYLRQPIRLSTQQHHFCRVELSSIVIPWEKVVIGVVGHGDGAMPEPLLHEFRRLPEPTIIPPIDQPARIEVP